MTPRIQENEREHVFHNCNFAAVLREPAATDLQALIEKRAASSYFALDAQEPAQVGEVVRDPVVVGLEQHAKCRQFLSIQRLGLGNLVHLLEREAKIALCFGDFETFFTVEFEDECLMRDEIAPRPP